MSRWRIKAAEAKITETDKEYTAQFDAHNVDTGALIKVQFTQSKPGPVSDVIGALRAIAQLLWNAANLDDADDAPARENMH